MNYEDTEDIAIELCERHPGRDPLQVRFTDLLEWVLAIPGFEGRREECNEGKLEAIQMAWYEEWKSNR